MNTQSKKGLEIVEYFAEGLHIVFSKVRGPNCGDCGQATYWSKVQIEDRIPFDRAVCRSPKCLNKF